MSKAIELIAVERRRQVESEGYDAEHDEAHDAGELLYMGALPLLKAITGAGPIAYDPWGLAKKHAHDRLRALTVAGALIAAQLDLELGEQPAAALSRTPAQEEPRLSDDTLFHIEAVLRGSAVPTGSEITCERPFFALCDARRAAALRAQPETRE